MSLSEEGQNVTEQAYVKLCKVFGVSDKKGLFKVLEKQNVPVVQACAKKLDKEGAWSCKECQGDSTCVMCNECYEKGKDLHKGHKVSFKTDVSGCCDCGDPDAWSPEGFCPDHRGGFRTEEDVDDYLQKCFTKEKQNQIISVLEELFQLVSERCNKEVDNTTHKLILEKAFFTKFIAFIKELSVRNTGMLHIICKLLMCNYPSPTTHKCIEIDGNCNPIQKMDTSEHMCYCPLIRNILSLWGKREKEDLLFFFLKNPKLKLYMGLTLFSIYDTLSSKMSEFSVQVTSSELAGKIGKSEEFLLHILDIVEEKLLKKNKEFVVRFFLDLTYLFKVEFIEEIKGNAKIYKKLIDIVCHLQNANKFKLSSSFVKDGYDENFVSLELHTLQTFLLVLYVLDTSNTETIKDILLYFSQKIIEFSCGDKALGPNEYTYHIPLYRIYGSFLVNLGFDYSYRNKCDFLEAIKEIEKMIPSYNEVSKILIEGTMKTVGFVFSTAYKFWVYYGETMRYYFLNYLNSRYVSYLDFSLLKILFSSDQNKQYLSFPKILELTSVNNSHLTFIENFYKKVEDIPKYKLSLFDETTIEKEIPFSVAVIETMSTAMRNSTWIYEAFLLPFESLYKSKLPPKSSYQLLMNDKENLVKIIRQEIIHLSLEMENSFTYSQMLEYIPSFFEKSIPENEIIKILEGCCDKVKTKNSQINFSVKKGVLKEYDSDFYLSLQSKSYSKKYIIESKVTDVSILNTVQIGCFNVQKSFETKVMKNYMLDNESNFDYIFSFSNGVLKNTEDFKKIVDSFLPEFLKIICVIGLNRNELNEKTKQKFIAKSAEVCDNLSKFSSKVVDESQKSYLKNFVLTAGSDSSQTAQGAPNKKAVILNKLKEKFKKLNKKVFQKYEEEINEISAKEKLDESHEKIYCESCRDLINQNNYSEDPFGKFGMTSFDFFLSNIVECSVEEEFKKLYKSIPFEKYFFEYQKEIKKPEDERLNLRIVSCQHYIHYKCFQNVIKKNAQTKNYFSCPLCKKLCSVYIPTFTIIKEKKFLNFIKGAELQKVLSKENLTVPVDHCIEIILNSAKIYLEDVVSSRERKKPIPESIMEKGKLFLCSKLLKDYFYYFFEYYDNSKTTFDKNNQINEVSNIIIALRIMIKAGAFQKDGLVAQLQNLLSIATQPTCAQKMIDENYVEDVFTELMFLLLTFVSYKDLIQNATNIFSLFVPYVLIAYYIKYLFLKHPSSSKKTQIIPELTISEMIEYYTHSPDKNKFDFLNRLYNKLQLCLDISKKVDFDDETPSFVLPALNIKDSNNNIIIQNILLSNNNIAVEKQNPLYKYVQKSTAALVKEIFEKYSQSIKDNENAILPPSLLTLGKTNIFNFIPLPELMIDFTHEEQKKKCENCKTSNRDGYVCLTCGKKYCNECQCRWKVENKWKVVKSFVVHGDECGGGNSAFISIHSGEIIFLSYKIIIRKNIFAYLNKFGEKVEGRNVNYEYTLNQSELKRGFDLWISLNYRKYNLLMDEEIIDFENLSILDYEAI